MMEELKLENQVCFPLYAVSRLVIQKYKPLLDKLGITYPQYLVLMVLWEQDKIPVKEISKKLFLGTNTLTPLLRRMQVNGLIERSRSKEDQRIVAVLLTEKGKKLQKKAREIPNELLCELSCFNIEKNEVKELKLILDRFIKEMSSKKQTTID